MWMARGLTYTLFGAMEYLTKCLGIATIGFNVTSKVVDKEQRKRYNQGTFEFGIPSPIFVPLVMASIIHLVALFGGLMEVLRGRNFDELFVQMFLVDFVVLNCWPICEAIV